MPMPMIFSAGGLDFEIPDEWWEAAGMEAFASSRTAIDGARLPTPIS